jgi:hypothetical protein
MRSIGIEPNRRASRASVHAGADLLPIRGLVINVMIHLLKKSIESD